jgi:hypothetical protein
MKPAFQFMKELAKKYCNSWEWTGEQWITHFVKRNNSVISLRESQATSLARATFNRCIVTPLLLLFVYVQSVIGIATSYGLDDWGRVQVPVGSRIFSSPDRPDRLWGPPIRWVPGVKRPGREVDHSPPTSAKVKKMWIYTATPIRFHGVMLN